VLLRVHWHGLQSARRRCSSANFQCVNGNIRFVGRKLYAPDGLVGINAANARLSGQCAGRGAHPVHLKLGSNGSALDLDHFAGLKLLAQTAKTGGNLGHIQSVSQQPLLSVAPDYRDRKYDLPAKLAPF
jgi:hypothetical protein